MEHLILKEALPREELSKLGLYVGGKFLLADDDISALLMGRRTNLLNLKNLQSEAVQIDSIDAKLSMHKNPDGEMTLKLHPIYKEVQLGEQLLKEEAEELVSGKIGKLEKTVPITAPKNRTLVFEYDQETREVISYDPSTVEIPVKINGEELSAEQKSAFSHGDLVELKDGTKLQHRASEPKGLLSDRSALIFSVLLDGGISYLLLRAIRSLSQDDNLQQSPFTPGFENAFNEMQKAENGITDPKLQQDELNEFKSEHSRGYWHGVSR